MGSESGTTLAAPRYGVREGHARVALDLPEGLPFQLAVSGNNLIVLFPRARATPFQLAPEGEHLSQLSYATVDDSLALTARTPYPLDRNRSGFRVRTLTGGNGTSKTLYLDFSPGLRSEAVRRLPDLAKTQPPAVRQPTEVRRAVLIDVGHGGEDPGASRDNWIEKELVPKVGLKLKTLLERRGVRVVMTRGGDYFVTLEDRAAFAVPSEHNLFISLHVNATERGDADGVETWIFGEP